MNEINLSYVITTRNKLPYLKEVMTRLLANVQEDEEIIVTDGASRDGTVEYLKDLYQQGKIHQFISEPDRGEAHGYNKGFLMARGKLIKDLTDDDAFYYPAIQECKKFMLEHEEVDAIAGNSAEANIEDVEDINSFKMLEDSERNYYKWFDNGSVVTFIGLPLMLRKKSLPFIGLYSTGMIQVDSEYTLRLTYLNANIAWNTGLISVRLANSQSNYRQLFSGKFRYLEERSRFLFFYDRQYRKLYYKELLRGLIRPIKSCAYKLLNILRMKNQSHSFQEIDNTTIVKAFSTCDLFMEKHNKNHKFRIICKP